MNHPRRRPLLRPGCVMLVAATLASSPQSTVADNAASPWIAHAVAQFGGAIGAIAVDNGTAAVEPAIVWVGRGPRVEAVDVSDPAAPKVVGRTPWLGGTVKGLAVSDGLGVAVLQPADELVALDLREAAQPMSRRRTKFERWSLAGDVELAGDFAYATYRHHYDAPDGRAVSRYTVAVVHVSDFAAPEIVTLDLIGDEVDVVDLRVIGGLLAVTVIGGTGPDGAEPVPQLRLYDLADPASPSLVGTLSDVAQSTLGGGPGVRNGTFVHACAASGDMAVVDVSAPRSPRVVRRWPLSDDMRDACDWGIEGALLIDADGSPFGVLGWIGGTVERLGDATVPTEPPHVQQLPNRPTAAVMAGRNVVVADNAGNVTVVDTGKLMPQPGSSAIAGTLPGIGEIVGLARRRDVDDGRLYAMQRHDGLRVLSPGEREQPTVVDRLRADGIRGFGHTRLSIVGGLAVAVPDSGCRGCSAQPVDVFDLRTPGALRHVGRIADGARTWFMTKGEAAWAIHGGASWRSTWRYRLAITSLERLSGPAVATFTPDHDLKYGAVVEDRFVAIGTDPDVEFGRCAPYAIEVWDLADPALPRRQSRLELPDCFNRAYTSMLLIGDVLYVAAGFTASDEDSALVVLRLLPDGSTRKLGRLPLPGAGSGLTVDDGRLFVKTSCPYDVSQGCVHVFDVRTPSAPRLEGWLFVGRNGGPAAVLGGRVYVLDDQDGGIWVFEPPPQPPRVDPHRLALPWLARGTSAASAR